MRYRKFIPLTLTLIFSLSVVVGKVDAQMRGPRYAAVSATLSPVSLKRGQSGKLILLIAVKPGFHINSAKPSDPDLIATAFAPSVISGVHFGAAKFPKDQMVKIDASPAPIPAYTGAVRIVVPISVALSSKPGKTAIGGTLTYQGCNANACFPPKQDQVNATLMVK